MGYGCNALNAEGEDTTQSCCKDGEQALFEATTNTHEAPNHACRDK